MLKVKRLHGSNHAATTGPHDSDRLFPDTPWQCLSERVPQETRNFPGIVGQEGGAEKFQIDKHLCHVALVLFTF
jgi:hypothetical protein